MVETEIERRQAPVEICQNCGAACCHKLSIGVNLPPRLAELFKVHYGQQAGKVRFTVYHKCPHLDKDNLCDLWAADPERDRRPAICQEFMCEKTDNPDIIMLEVKGVLDDTTDDN